MKKYIVFINIILIVINLCSCASAPDEVVKSMNNYRDEKSISNEKFEFEYISTEKIIENANYALKEKYNQFSLENGISIIEPNELSIIKFQFIDNFRNNFNDVMNLFFTQEEIEAQNISDGNMSYSFYNETDKMYGCVENNGFISMLKSDGFDISFAYNKPNIKIYHVDRNDDLSDKYQLKNGECSIGEAVDYIYNWFETKYKKFFPDYDYKVKTVIVREIEDYYLFEISTEIFYKNVPLDSFTMEMETDETNMSINIKHIYNRIDIQMINVNQISTFTNTTGVLKPIEAEKVNECISLESALKFCENTFTDFKDITISDIGIKYITSPDYDYLGKQGPYDAGIIVDSRPVWEFVIDVDPSEFLKKGEVNTYGDVRKYIYIDMITGELMYNFDIVLQGLG